MRIRSSTAPAGPSAPAAKASSANGGERRPIGRILDIEPNQADAVLARQAQTGKLFGETAVEMGVSSEIEVRRAVEQQQGYSVLAEDDQRIDPLVVAAFHPDDALAEAARDLRSVIASAKRIDGNPVQSVALLGQAAATETSIVAANLAVVCAQAGYRTLLVDANLGRPQHHRLFRVHNRSGLSTVLSTGEGADQAIQPTALPSLSLIASGPAVPNAPELFERQRLAQCADQLVDGFDLLIADVANADGSGTAASLGLDAAIIVLRRDVSGVRAMQSAIDHLQRHGTTVLGTVLTA